MVEEYRGKIRAAEIVKKIRNEAGFVSPRIGFILGSGWGQVLNALENKKIVSYHQIGMPQCGVAGHAGNLVFGDLGGTSVVLLQGRYHLYEGRDIGETVLPVCIMKELGVDSIVLTNAAGGINPAYSVGDLMFLSDHINLTGKNPLIGVKATVDFPVFVDMCHVYDRAMTEAMVKASYCADLTYHKGVYMQVLGPSFETPAEIRAFRALGADAVGMSTVCEAVYAKYLHLKVAGISCITNMAAGMVAGEIKHEDVLAESTRRAEKFSIFLQAFVREYMI